MSISTTKQIASVSYNGTDIPLKSAQEETWVLNNSLDISSAAESIYIVDFLVPSKEDDVGVGKKLFLSGNTLSGEFKKKTEQGSILTTDTLYSNGAWRSQADRKFIFDQPTTGTLRTWLEANAVLQEDNLAIEPKHNVTITSNGITTVDASAPYDGMAEVEVVTNISGMSYPFPMANNNSFTSITLDTIEDVIEVDLSNQFDNINSIDDLMFMFKNNGSVGFYVDGANIPDSGSSNKFYVILSSFINGPENTPRTFEVVRSADTTITLTAKNNLGDVAYGGDDGVFYSIIYCEKKTDIL